MSGVMILRLLLWSVGQGPWVWPDRGRNPLVLAERYVAGRFPVIEHIDPAALAARLAATDERIVLFDVREAAEFAISHIAGAVRVDPAMDAKAFQRQYGELIEGRDVVVYCAVGLRSSRLGQRLVDGIVNLGGGRVINLSGGIFRWSNEQRPLVDRNGSTRAVHSYDAFWSRFLLP